MIKRATVVVLALVSAVAWSATSALANGASGRFSDDDTSIHEPAIEAVAAIGVTRGCNPPASDRFCPDSPVTRGQMAAFVHRSFAGRALGTPLKFTDTSDSIFLADITWLSAAGITKGCNPPDNTRFCPDGHVTRGEMAAFLVRALDLTGNAGSSFSDDDGSVFERDIALLADAGITKGCNPPVNDRFCPDRSISRAEMATFLTRALDVPPRLPTLDLINGYDCAKDGIICRATITSPGGRRVQIDEGWDHALPFATGEEPLFNAAQFDLIVNGASWTVDPEPATAGGSLRSRRWSGQLTIPTSGSITIEGRWRWEGIIERRTILMIVAG